MKKTILIILTSVLLFSFASCDSSKTPAETKGPAETVRQTETETEAVTTEGVDLSNVEIDITKMNSTMVYSQVYDMLVSPDDYIGKTVKMTGAFTLYEGDTRNYYACLIQDATACCSQGLEFVLDGDFKYPQDYPAVGSDITVVGVFDSYYEGSNRYVQLIHAKMS
jgi:hypothetical protein